MRQLEASRVRRRGGGPQRQQQQQRQQAVAILPQAVSPGAVSAGECVAPRGKFCQTYLARVGQGSGHTECIEKDAAKTRKESELATGTQSAIRLCVLIVFNKC